MRHLFFIVFNADFRRGWLGLLLLAPICLPGHALADYTCTVTATDVAFGSYSTFNSIDVDSTGIITVSCDWINGGNETVEPMVSISAGSSGTFFPRKMTSGGSYLEYNLYQKSNHTRVWGDGAGGSLTQSTKKCQLKPSKPNCVETLDIYGHIPADQSVAAGNYSDVLFVTIDF